MDQTLPLRFRPTTGVPKTLTSVRGGIPTLLFSNWFRTLWLEFRSEIVKVVKEIVDCSANLRQLCSVAMIRELAGRSLC